MNRYYDLKLVDDRLVIDLHDHDDQFRAKGYTGLPETFDLAEISTAPVVGTVQLEEEQFNRIMAEYTGGGECAWCGEVRKELREPHIFDRAPNGGKMCRHCWDHDREVYKGSYGEDIGPFDGDDRIWGK
ncbi:hypothetical protein WJ0W_004614 [Paenibacillus melissococcoides]|uniref:HNH endonuclease n=1 Tax=Paenibacillus melissococcoides TaxID=2912268 RepID=A0ABN8UC33_9BACL|nr:MULTISPECIES: hypothetical protein [Paenibacillus]MEB9897692.1 hypothetical protein [Bacillus cereus]CAH8247380.1 hypothetical protein WJ0W_004614 [Paenibacillus melissococcoides]CAH8705316.1 hypothetical protein WDD9_000934 [Paenibacillus melissococcoides]CAH8708537.1 hypothetical protein HTL2_002019 [Paenibacillus melissococcoides]GIO82867.1 hypothetical protein J6TS7_64770 [Paenibacillus dendritiformis]